MTLPIRQGQVEGDVITVNCSVGDFELHAVGASRIVAAAVTGFVIEATRKIVSRRTGSLLSAVFTPMEST
jgi:hypothetical protein